MKAKTKFEKYIVAEQKNLPEISKAQKDWIFENVFNHFVYATKKKNLCFSCRHEWQGSYDKCPSCGRKLTKLKGKTRIHADSFHVYIHTTYKGNQLARLVFVQFYYNALKPEQCYFRSDEVAQHWLNSKGQHKVFGCIASTSWYSTYWHSGFEIRSNDRSCYYQKADIYPRQRFIPELKRNGFKGNYYGYNPMTFFKFLIKDPMFETLVKRDEKALIDNYCYKRELYKKYWQQIKICFRNNYKMDPHLWFNYIDMLVRYDKDIHSPKYLCPLDLRKAHNKYLEKVRKENAAKKKQELIEQRNISNMEYKKKISKFTRLSIVDGEIIITPLINIQDFIREEDTHKHCVFSSKYYEDEGTIIMKAKVNGKRTETIEFSLDNMKVVQCRGYDNKNTDYHERIINAINSNVHLIKKCL